MEEKKEQELSLTEIFINNEFEIDYSKNKDISNYETEDEYKNNEIEYVE